MGTVILILLGAAVVVALAVSGAVAATLAVVVVVAAIIAIILALMGAAFVVVFKLMLALICLVFVQVVCHKLLQLIGSRGNVPALCEEPLSGRIAWILSAIVIGYFGFIR